MLNLPPGDALERPHDMDAGWRASILDPSRRCHDKIKYALPKPGALVCRQAASSGHSDAEQGPGQPAAVDRGDRRGGALTRERENDERDGDARHREPGRLARTWIGR